MLQIFWRICSEPKKITLLIREIRNNFGVLAIVFHTFEQLNNKLLIGFTIYKKLRLSQFSCLGYVLLTISFKIYRKNYRG